MTPSAMKWANVSAVNADLSLAAAQAIRQLRNQWPGEEPHLLLVFVAAMHSEALPSLARLLAEEFESTLIVGGLGLHVVGNQAELENQPAISLMAALLPNVILTAQHVEQVDLPPLYAPRSRWAATLGIDHNEPRCLMLLADPFTFNAEALVAATDRVFTDAVCIGGLSSGAEQPDQPCLLLGNQVHRSGALCLTMSGDIEVDCLVAQGCRPIGEPMFANATHDNLILQLDGRVPRELLTELYQRLPRADKKLFTESLFMGIAMQSSRERFGAGDFLIRTLLGLDPDSGALLLNARVTVNSVVQLHLRDAGTATEELQHQLLRYRQQQSISPAGALLFSCLGRGSEFYGSSDHDSALFRQVLGDAPLCGMFCNGEIGPVAGHTYVHGYTSVFAIFRKRVS